MPRPPKNKTADAAKPSAAPVRVIDVDNFIRVRDSVYQRLLTMQDLIKSFSQDYLRQTNLLLGEGTNLEGGELDMSNFALGALIPGGLPMPQPAVEEKKERKKRTHDPNAPKRPLTPYFLYMQTARPIIASDLGDEAPKGAVQEEGQRRWSVMGAAEKQGWNTAYQYNLRLYNARVHSYKHGNPNAKNMTDEEAIKYADDFGIEMPPTGPVEEVVANDQDAIAEQLQLSVPLVTEDSEEEPTPVAKTPKKGGKDTRKRKTATPAAAEVEPAKIAATPVSPEAKKRKRVSKAAEISLEEPKKSGRKKTKSG
ncbi:hypothetical protein B0T19DRAFT_408457 [Cercophora scortea]|uniref:HMG box domain-containing protein n=1 Tax=Cercophora scortea TaxID=314031 RepID=A0AAE0J4I9_9PEZI|nr:hypothetical protein B0T19DRAFT_408457 [Cercophora scortea]